MAAISGGLLAPHDPNASDLNQAYFGPSAGHPLGFDGQGRDLLSRLLVGARTAFREAHIDDTAFDIVHVPGAFELPLVAKTMASSGNYSAIICLGAVIRGDTDHYDYVCRAATEGIVRAGMDTGVPVIFGVLTCENEEQAVARAGGAEGNKGTDAVFAALEMVEVMKRIR